MAATTAIATQFALAEKYQYNAGLGSYHSTEAAPGANPKVINSPQKPPYGLLTERVSGTSFTAPRDQNLQTWLYRVASSLDHTEFVPYGSPPDAATSWTPNSYLWPGFELPTQADWTAQTLLARNGDPMTKSGLAIWLFEAAVDMTPNTAFASNDGETLIIPHSGALDIQTELGRLLVRQNEIALIPRGIKYRVTLPAGTTRGYICELYQGHFQLPNLGVVGSTGLANVRDFEVPVASFDGEVSGSSVKAHDTGDWTIITRSNASLWAYKQDHTPFDVVAWHGTNYPYKYDLSKFCVLGNALFDEHDPSMYVVLTAPSSSSPGSAVVEFAIISERWQVAENTLWVPYFHRNTMSEFFGPIVRAQHPKHPLNRMKGWLPFGAGVHPPMKTHGSTKDEYRQTQDESTAPKKIQTEGVSVFLLETERPLYVTEAMKKAALSNFKAEAETRAKSSL